MTFLSRLRAVVTDDREIEALVEAAAGGGAVYGTSGVIDYICGDAPRVPNQLLCNFQVLRACRWATGPLACTERW